MDYLLYLRAYFNIYVGNYGQAFEYADNLFINHMEEWLLAILTYMYIQIMIAFMHL